MRKHGHARRAVTLVELLVVLAIMAALLLGLLLPAVQSAREAARRASCQSNLHQLNLAMHHYADARGKCPNPPTAGTMSGWAIDILPFIEEKALANQVAGVPFDSPQALPAARIRPPIMRCPGGYDGDSSVATIPASHYWASCNRAVKRSDSSWTIGEMPTSSRVPWVTSPEGPQWPGATPSAVDLPHVNGYYFITGDFDDPEADRVLFRSLSD